MRGGGIKHTHNAHIYSYVIQSLRIVHHNTSPHFSHFSQRLLTF
uniref:Uncharacterized protein n=1 Tax=Anguilla anguilla TaxID=7936 RepID=A0A0E9XLL1_ANGAN